MFFWGAIVADLEITYTVKRLIPHVFLCCLMVSSGVALSEPHQPIDINITTHLGDVHDFNQGDTISFLLSLNRDAYVLVIYENADGEIIQLMPNEAMQNSFFKAGLYITIPAHDSAFVFKVQKPYGKETIWAFASSAPMQTFDGKPLHNGLKLLSGNIAQIATSLAADQKEFGQTQFNLHTHKLK